VTAARDTIHEMVCQRLGQGFQIIVTSDSAPGAMQPTNQAAIEPSAFLDRPVYLSISNDVHRLVYNRDTHHIDVSIFTRLRTWPTKPYSYSFFLWPRSGASFDMAKVQFSYPDLEEFDFHLLDRLIAGMEKPELHESLRYWRTRFCFIPAPVSNRDYVVKSSGDILDVSSSDEEIRLAGILRLMELFERARWRSPSGKSEDSGSPISYLFTTSDPGIFVRCVS
jgi:hypothetical protein